MDIDESRSDRGAFSFGTYSPAVASTTMLLGTFSCAVRVEIETSRNLPMDEAKRKGRRFLRRRYLVLHRITFLTDTTTLETMQVSVFKSMERFFLYGFQNRFSRVGLQFPRAPAADNTERRILSRGVANPSWRTQWTRHLWLKMLRT